MSSQSQAAATFFQALVMTNAPSDRIFSLMLQWCAVVIPESKLCLSGSCSGG